MVFKNAVRLSILFLLRLMFLKPAASFAASIRQIARLHPVTNRANLERGFAAIDKPARRMRARHHPDFPQPRMAIGIGEHFDRPSLGFGVMPSSATRR